MIWTTNPLTGFHVIQILTERISERDLVKLHINTSDLRTATLIKDNSFTSIFQSFCLIFRNSSIKQRLSVAACGLESVHFKTTFSEQLAVAVSEIVLFYYLHLALILHII